MSALEDQEILPLSLRHNFWTWSAQAHVAPISVTRAQGVYFWDVNGRRYLDLNAMTMCVNAGHGHPKIIGAIQRQVAELAFASPAMATRPRAELGALLSEITPPGLERFLYTLGGADANENAVKLARAYTGRFKILASHRSYHGATYGAMALTGDPRRLDWQAGLMPGVVHFHGPDRYRPALHTGDRELPDQELAQVFLDHLEEVIQQESPGSIAAIVLEPIPGSNGVLVPPDGYLPGVRKLCDRYGILLVADEVMTGFGRTGAWFAVDRLRVVPDMLTMAKGITSGYAPLGALAMRAEIAAHFNERVFQGGLTFNGHPLSLAAAIANIQVLRDEKLVEHARSLGGPLSRHLTAMRDQHPSVGDVRSIGFFGVLELVTDRRTRKPMGTHQQPHPAVKGLQKRLLEAGVYTFVRHNMLLICPPLSMTTEQLSEGFGAIDKALAVTDEAALNESIDVPA